ncbi:hypothetical protein [Glaciecola sp. SC05]|uniref:hypothetical protein n=1 Tax=Glaciecola sp. SC05 TaxID=1987355 RepID=UPI003529A727
MKRSYLSVLLLLAISGCNNAPKYVEKMPPLILENGLEVSSCHDYEQMRSVFKVGESVANKRVSADYLVCSLAIDLTEDLDSESTMRRIFHGLMLRDIPTSLSAGVFKQSALSGAGFQLWLEKSMLTFENDQTSIQIQYKGKLKNGNHLVWVSDLAQNANYAAFFPAIIIMQDGKVLGTAPIYASGY